MAILTSSLSSGGAPLGLIDFDSGIIPSTASAGALLTVTAAGANQYIKLNQLGAGTSDVQPNMSLSVDGTTVFSNVDLIPLNSPRSDASAGNTGFIVLNTFAGDNNTQTARILPPFTCKTFTLTLESGSTTRDIDYAYETLEELL